MSTSDDLVDLGIMAVRTDAGDDSVAIDSLAPSFLSGAAAPAITISGAAANQAATDGATFTPLKPFQGIVLNDTNGVSETATLTVTLSSPANGTLIDNGTFFSGTYDAATGVYTITARVNQVNSA